MEKRHTETTPVTQNMITKQHLINKNNLKRYRNEFASKDFYTLAMTLPQH